MKQPGLCPGGEGAVPFGRVKGGHCVLTGDSPTGCPGDGNIAVIQAQWEPLSAAPGWACSSSELGTGVGSSRFPIPFPLACARSLEARSWTWNQPGGHGVLDVTKEFTKLWLCWFAEQHWFGTVLQTESSSNTSSPQNGAGIPQGRLRAVKD